MANIGIDFGTTNSVLVSYDKKNNKFDYFHFAGDKPIPTSSTIWYHDNEIIVGKNARDNIHTFYDSEGHHFEKSIKLKLGQDYCVNIFGENYTSSDIASEIIKQLKNEAIKRLGSYISYIDINKAVFTVPINFSGKARRNLREAANKAGIEVSTFIHEPFAAIVGYYFTKNSNSFNDIINELQSMNDSHMLVFDWGGGTLDITVVKIIDGKMLEIGTSELTGKAGDAFDEEIARWAWNKFLDKLGNKYTLDYLENIRKKKWGRLIAIAEKSKIELSTDDETLILMESVIPGEDEEIAEILTRDEFSKIIENIVNSACNKVDDALSYAQLNTNNISQVLMVGGSCNIPYIQNRLKEKFGHRVEFLKNADLAIAQGAAVVSELGWMPFLTKDILLELSDDSYYQIFESGLQIAKNEDAIKLEMLTCVDQRNGYAKLIICDGNGQKKNSTLAIMNVPVLADRRFGDDIELKARIDNNIILHISANSKLVNNYDQNISKQKNIEIHKLCFGLECKE